MRGDRVRAMMPALFVFATFRSSLLLACCLLAAARAAHADLLARAIDEAGGAAPPNDTMLAWAGPARPTSLPELLQIAVRQAPSLESARIDIEIAQAQIEQTWARRDWLLGAQASGQWSQAGLVSGVAVDDTIRFAIGADITRPLSTGGTIGLHARTAYSKTDATLFGSENWSDDLSVSLAQPLLRGRGRAIYDANEQRAKLSRDANVLGRRLAALQTVEGVVNAYWDLVLAQRQVAITDASLALARERLRVTEIGAEGGKIARAEIPAVLQIIATREEEVLGGELAVIDRSIALRRAANLTIGAGEIRLRVDTDLATRDQGFSLGPLLERAYAASPELAQLEKQTAGTTIEIDVTENGLLPQLDLELALGPTGIAPTAYGAARNLVSLDSFAVTGQLTFSRALDQYDVRGRSKELRLVRTKVRVNAIDVRAQIASALARAVGQIELAKRRVLLSQRAIDLANENIRIETDRFNLGKATNFDILNRLEEQRQAELRKAQALIDWHKAETVVQTLTGELLDVFGISVD
jgi:outer membrane protein